MTTPAVWQPWPLRKTRTSCPCRTSTPRESTYSCTIRWTALPTWTTTSRSAPSSVSINGSARTARVPARPKYFSATLGYQIYWSKGVRLYTEFLQGHEGGVKGLSLRYIGTFVSDFHRNLLAGGVFYYPADSKAPRTPHGKLRLLSECAPLAFVAEAQLAVGRP